jgi:Ca2+-binding RTX toxin-like protein
VDISGANVGMTITGGSAVDQITGSTDIDEISGGAGDDVIDGGGGDDTITGGIGDDTIDVGAGDNMVEMTGTIANLGRDEVSEFTVGADDIFQFTGANIGDGNTTLTFSSAAAVNAGANAELTVATTALADDAAITAAIQGSTETTPSLFVFYNNNDTEAQVWYDADPNLDGGETELVGLPDVAQADLGNITVTNFVDLV